MHHVEQTGSTESRTQRLSWLQWCGICSISFYGYGKTFCVRMAQTSRVLRLQDFRLMCRLGIDKRRRIAARRPPAVKCGLLWIEPLSACSFVDRSLPLLLFKTFLAFFFLPRPDKLHLRALVVGSRGTNFYRRRLLFLDKSVLLQAQKAAQRALARKEWRSFCTIRRGKNTSTKEQRVCWGVDVCHKSRGVPILYLHDGGQHKD